MMELSREGVVVIESGRKEGNTIPVRLNFLSLKDFSNLVAVVDEEQIWMTD